MEDGRKHETEPAGPHVWNDFWVSVSSALSEGSWQAKAGGTEEEQVQYVLESCGHLSLSLVLG